MQQLNIHEEAIEDFKQLHLSDPKASEKIAVVLSEIKGNEWLMDNLTVKGKWKQGNIHFETYRFSEQWKQGRDLYVVKVLEITGGSVNHRIIHAYNPKTKHHYVLGIVPRSFNYESQNDYTKRIVRTYDKLRDEW